MTPAALPLKLSAASVRMAGYMIENNLRVAQVFGQAAISSNPFLAQVKVKSAKSVAKDVNENSLSSTKTSGLAAPIKTAKVKSAASTQTRPVLQKSTPMPKAPVTEVKKAKPVAAAPKSQPAVQDVKTVAKAAVSQATSPTKPVIGDKPKKLDAQSVVAAKPVKTVVPAATPVARAEMANDTKVATAKPRREPATPPAMPAAPKAQVKPAEKHSKK